jgi:hypothetical protein
MSNYQFLTIVFSFLALIIGSGLFKSGFLLSRISISEKSQCDDFHVPLSANPTQGCWLPRPHPTVKRVIIVIIDALRYDFAAWDEALEQESIDIRPETRTYRNKLSIFHNTTNGFSRLYRFLADPPTTTLQRLKALVTGSLPTFIELSENFHGREIREDSLIFQFSHANSLRSPTSTTEPITPSANISFMGDDTWLSLYPDTFQNAWPFPSFDVWDLHTVDNGVLKHLYDQVDQSNWDVLIAHFLGVDHVGHRYFPAHPTMSKKLRQLNHALMRLTNQMDNDTVLFVFGDHGMDKKGDHGGDSIPETHSALWIYSKQNIFTTRPASWSEIPNEFPKLHTKAHLGVNQIDLVPTIALLLGLPIPMESLGTIIPELFPNLSQALEVNALQVRRYLTKYATKSKDFQELLPVLLKIEDPKEFLHQALQMCRSVWARFQVAPMQWGMAWVIGSSVLLAKNCRLSQVYGLLPSFLTSIIYFSDSFTVYEDSIYFFLLQSILLGTCFRHKSQWGTTCKSVAASLALNVMAFQVTSCREEQAPCYNTFHDPGIGTWVGILGMGYFTWISSGSTRISKLQGVLVLIYGLIEEEFWTTSRAWPIWLARFHLTLSLLSFARWPKQTRAQHIVSIFAFVTLFHRPVGLVSLSSLAYYLLYTSSNPKISPSLHLVLLQMYSRVIFFTTGHQATLTSIEWRVGHTGLWTTHYWFSPFFVLMNFVGHLALILIFLDKSKDSDQQENKSTQLYLLLEMVHYTMNCIAAFHLRHHLMAWSVFAPRWMLSSLIILLVFGLLLLRYTVLLLQRQRKGGPSNLDSNSTRKF